ncbi:MAG: sensor hybrid histidine kinase [Holophagaceae bacterium]|nr:sensor hybrid histidine kinase [Holophagaceae bacterium]
MPRRFEQPEEWDHLRQKILGLGENSIHKSHFAELQQRIQQLEASERKFALAFQANPALMCLSALEDGRLLEANQTFLHTLGLTLEDAIGKTSLELGIWPEPEAYRSVMGRLKVVGSIHLLELPVHRKDGSLVETLSSMVAVEVEGQDCVLFMAIDITEIKQAQQERERLQAQLLQAQKMDAIGQLAGGVAHDFNNLLTIINLNAEMLGIEGEPPPKGLEEIMLAAQRAQDLTRQLLTFGRKQPMETMLCDLNQVVSETGKMLQRIIGEHIQLEINLAPDPSMVVVDPSQLSQVMMNLAINARDAMPQGGHLLLETSRTLVEEHHQRAKHQDVLPGVYAVIAMADTGCGMDEATLNHIFEPFFTTKEKGKGTGLGLAMVYGIVKQSGGHVWVYSEPGRGTQFKIYLPLNSAEEAPSLALPSLPLRPGWETVLLVEDDAAVRALVVGALASWGYQVLEAADPLAALQITDAHSDPIHLLITDVVMPYFNGPDLAQRILQQRPDLRVLFVSGYTDGAIIHQESELKSAEFLQKPFNMKTLNQKVRAILDALPT